MQGVVLEHFQKLEAERTIHEKKGVDLLLQAHAKVFCLKNAEARLRYSPLAQAKAAMLAE
ncbi:hypothetical protein AMD24_00790 [Candidatus Xiphinematobacter sp. Idaho Grape]|nr:hypothetical protein AMD24_00790 [Candidatus Xiphinematobacter sp. Idaho Grape]